MFKVAKLLKLIHIDLGDFYSSPFGGKKYYVAFIDDFSRYCQVHLLHTRSEALEKFRIFKNECEWHYETFIKRLRSRKSGEYYDPIFFQSIGIIHKVTEPYTPEQNRVAEMKN